MSGLTGYRRIDDDDHAPVQRLAIRSVGRHRVGVAVTEGLEASRGHPVREEPALDGLGAQQGKLKIAAWSGKAIACSSMLPGKSSTTTELSCRPDGRDGAAYRGVTDIHEGDNRSAPIAQPGLPEAEQVRGCDWSLAHAIASCQWSSPQTYARFRWIRPL